MEIYNLNNVNELKKYYKRYKFDSGDFYCIYFGNKNNDNCDIFDKLKLKVLIPNKIGIDKEEFKSNYVEFIGNLSNSFTSKMWWATQTAAKFRNITPFILYKLKIVSVILDKYAIEKLIVIDESYLFNRSLLFFSKNKSIKFISFTSRARVIYYNIKPYLLFLCSAHYNLVKLLYKIILANYLFNKKLKQIKTVQPIRVIKTFAYLNSFDKKGRFVDKFFGDLPMYFKDNGYQIISLVASLGNYNKIIRKIAKDDKNIVLPIELFIKPNQIVSEFINLITLKFELKKNIFFEKNQVAEFINLYLSSNKKNELALDHVLYYIAAKNFLKYFQVEILISTYENIPWEPMFFLAFKKFSHATKIIGYQHTVVSDFSTNYFLSKWEMKNRPLPDKIITVGEIAKNIIIKNSNGVYPGIENSCALRYKNMNFNQTNTRNTSKKILIALEGISDVYHLVNFVLNQLCKTKNYEIIIRPHPVLPMSKINKNINLDYTKYNNISISTNNNINDDLEQVSIVIYRESTVALEALAFGLPVICFVQHPIITFDPLFELNYFKWNITRAQKLEPLLHQIYNMEDNSYYAQRDKAIKYVKSYFPPCTGSRMSKFANI